MSAVQQRSELQRTLGGCGIWGWMRSLTEVWRSAGLSPGALMLGRVQQRSTRRDKQQRRKKPSMGHARRQAKCLKEEGMINWVKCYLLPRGRVRWGMRTDYWIWQHTGPLWHDQGSFSIKPKHCWVQDAFVTSVKIDALPSLEDVPVLTPANSISDWLFP